MCDLNTHKPAIQETLVRFLGWADPLEKEMATFWPGEFHGQRSLVGWLGGRSYKEVGGAPPQVEVDALCGSGYT